MAWQVVREGREVAVPDGTDATIWEWLLKSEDGAERSVLVQISGTAMATDDVHSRVANARESEGQTEVHRVLDWDDPPFEIRLDSRSEAPALTGGNPGAGAAEMAEIARWFQDRGIALVWTSRGIGLSRKKPEKHSANLIDLEADKLVARFEAPWQLEAVRNAQEWWQNRGRGAEVIVEAQPATATASGSATVETTRPHVPPEDLEEVKRQHLALVWTEPDPEDVESRWQVTVYEEDGLIRGVALGFEPDEALVNARPYLFPAVPEDP